MKEYSTDMFCGAGGTSTGLLSGQADLWKPERRTGRMKTIPGLSERQDEIIRRQSEQSPRSKRIRAQRQAASNHPMLFEVL